MCLAEAVWGSLWPLVGDAATHHVNNSKTAAGRGVPCVQCPPVGTEKKECSGESAKGSSKVGPQYTTNNTLSLANQ